jgi:hypothetical protein
VVDAREIDGSGGADWNTRYEVLGMANETIAVKMNATTNSTIQEMDLQWPIVSKPVASSPSEGRRVSMEMGNLCQYLVRI